MSERSSTPRMMVLPGNFSSTEQSSLDCARFYRDLLHPPSLK
jgi:hypothetical protein